jgi:thiamine-phosphate pyrophosphorylase
VTVCFVTDRRRLGGSADDVRRAAAAAIAAGVDLIQIRERDLDARPLLALVTAVVADARGTKTSVVINDRLDVAIVSGAHGVHLRADSIAVADARALAPRGFLVGRSVHSVREAQDAAGADYLIAGTVFPSPSKPGLSTLLGLEGLRTIVSACSAPVLAIGGITSDRIPEIVAAGAVGYAAIGLFAQRFDSLKTAP